MTESATEIASMIIAVVMYFGGLLIWPAQACIRRRWDVLAKALGIVWAVHLLLLIVLVLVSDALFGSDAHHAWWLFVLLNLGSCFGSIMTWLVTSVRNESRSSKGAV